MRNFSAALSLDGTFDKKTRRHRRRVKLKDLTASVAVIWRLISFSFAQYQVRKIVAILE